MRGFSGGGRFRRRTRYGERPGGGGARPRAAATEGGPEAAGVRSPWWARGRGRLGLPRTRAGQRRAVRILVGLCVLVLLPPGWLFLTTGDRLRSTAEVPRTEVAVVFGAGLQEGRPSRYLAHRLDTAAELYRRGRIKVVLVTGDNSRASYDEPDAMRAYLTRHGVPDERIVSDYAGFDTWDSCARAHRVFGVDRAVLISQAFHIRRAVALCESAGVTAYGVGVEDRHDLTWYYGATRELFAAGKAAVDAVFRPDPHFLGPREKGVAQALARAE
ncbi:DUF218 domain-containing protein [Streptomyces sp. LD120]|uniref:DUF218 domain-containing protein n=1 Tax=Streptomyces physcomitrii TaxID=2724184 RepID=A0ABX1H744_9ACTN|nr:DUF218 domain-containing protein [Streptomyces physcomitrii]